MTRSLFLQEAYGPYHTPAPLAPFANTTSLSVAMSHNTLGVGYAGAGFLLFYYIGVSQVLQQLGVIKPGRTKTAGASGGILCATVDYGFVTHDQFLRVGKDFVARCRAKNNCASVLSEEILAVTEKLAPPDIAERISGIGYIALAYPNANGWPIGDYVSNYTSRADAISAIYAGTYLPMWGGPTMTTTKFRGKPYYDGALRTPLPCPRGNTTFCLKVSVVPPLHWNAEQVVAGAVQNWPELLRAVTSTLEPNPAKFLLGAIGEQLRRPFERQEAVPAGAVAFLSNQPPADLIDIYPGKYHPNPFSLVEWMSMVLVAPTDETIDRMVEMGEKDAQAWARQMGLLPAALAGKAGQ